MNEETKDECTKLSDSLNSLMEYQKRMLNCTPNINNLISNELKNQYKDIFKD